MDNTIDLSGWHKLWEGQRGADSPVKIIGVRGALQPQGGANETGIYDDLVVVLIDGAVTAWRASVDPAPALIRNPINADGAAQLCPGVHLLQRHLLHGNSAYPCLAQAEAVHVRRLDKTGRVTQVQFGWYGIALHSGGAGTDTQNLSAGCSIIWNPDGYHRNPTWASFIGPIYRAMAAHQLTAVPYLLTEDSGYGAPLPPLSNA